MFHLARQTIQNWESGASAMPTTLAGACEVWTDRLRKQRADLGPVTLIYADAPMFVSPYGRRGKVAMLQQEPYATNAAALARVRILGPTGLPRTVHHREGSPAAVESG